MVGTDLLEWRHRLARLDEFWTLTDQTVNNCFMQNVKHKFALNEYIMLLHLINFFTGQNSDPRWYDFSIQWGAYCHFFCEYITMYMD